MDFESRLERKRREEVKLAEEAKGQPPLVLTWHLWPPKGLRSFVLAQVGDYEDLWGIFIRPRGGNLPGWTGYIEEYTDRSWRVTREFPSRRNSLPDEMSAKRWVLRRLRAARAESWILTPLQTDCRDNSGVV